MAAKVKSNMGSIIFKKKDKVKHPGIHSKKKTSFLKSSKLYKKKYRGQGRS